jgi:radical SAM superfamily enzyme YgiQ (UPF0313 family)
MKVLLINPQADFSFWTLPASSRLTGSKTLAPPLGLITAAALLPGEWELRFRDRNVEEVAESDWDWADMVMMSAMLGQRNNMLALIREAGERKKPVVVGGPYPTSLSAEVLDAGANFLVRGEAENVIDSLLAAIKGGKKGGVFENPEKPDVTGSPIPRYDLITLKDYQLHLVQTSRGCPFNCEFCDIVNLYGRSPRYKAPEQVINEFESLYRLGWRGTIFVGDDNFIGNKTHAKAILEKMIKWQKSHGEPFGLLTQASINLGQDKEMIDLLTAANFGNIFIGIESPDKEVLERSGKHQNVRNPLAESIDNINRNGLVVQGGFIIGFDGEEKGAGERISRFVEETNIPCAMINCLRALPNTRLWDRLKEEGRLHEAAQVGELLAGSPFNFDTARPESEIVEEFVRVWDYLYEPARYFARTYRYFANMRPTRAALGIEDQDSQPAAPQEKFSLKKRLKVLRSFLMLLWMQGISPPASTRRAFWKYFHMMWRKNPSRLVTYLQTCGLGENMFSIRAMLLKNHARLDERRESKELPASGPHADAGRKVHS